MAGYDIRVPKIVTGRNCVRHRQRGVTMVELIAVLIITGVLGAVAAGRYVDRASFEADAFTDQARSMLRYAQKVAIAQNRDVFVRLDGKSIAACFDSACSAAGRVFAPAGADSGSAATLAECGNAAAWFCEAVPQGVSYAASGSLAGFRFDALGRPFNSADSAISGISTFQRSTIAISGDGATRTLTIEPETGYVH